MKSGATLELVGVTLRNGNVGTSASGGAIDNNGRLVISNSEVLASTASSGGAIFTRANTTVELDHVTLADNTASPAGGLGGAISTLGSGMTVTITDSTLRNNLARLGGGAIFNTGTLVVTNSTFDGNRSIATSTSANNTTRGGAIFTSTNTTLSITGSTLTGNIAQPNITGTASGGGLFSDTGSTVTIASSTFDHNQVLAGTGTANLLGGGWASKGTGTITNSTFSGNFAKTDGGAIHLQVGTIALNHVTIADNSADHDGGGVFVQSGTLQARNTLIATNRATNSNPDVAGAFTTQGHNLIGALGSAAGFTNSVNGDLVGTGGTPIDPKIGPLANNGGPTRTHTLLVSQAGETLIFSPALDAGDNTGAPTFDQRGLPRLVDGDNQNGATVDIGAFELPLNRRPDISSQTFALNENVALGTLVGHIIASDPDGNLTPLAMVGGDRDAFTLNAATGDLFLNTALDFEARTTYSVTIQATDTAGLQRNAVVTLNVTNVNETPFVVGSGFDDRTRRDGDAAEAVDLRLLFGDPDAGDSLTYSVRANSNSQLVTTQIVNGHDLALTYLTYSASQSRLPSTVTVRATDAGGAFVEDTFQVAVTPRATFEYALVVTRFLDESSQVVVSPESNVTTLPTSITSVLPNQEFFVEVWVRDLLAFGRPEFPLSLLNSAAASQGVVSAGVDLRFDPLLSTYQGVDATGSFSFPANADSVVGGLVNNLHGSTPENLVDDGAVAQFGRLGSVKFQATGTGLQSFALSFSGDEGVEYATARKADGAANGTIDTSQIRFRQPIMVGVDPEGSAGATRLFAAPLVIPLNPLVNPLLPAATSPTALAVADFDGRGGVDLVTANGNSQNARVLLNAPQIGHTVTLNPGNVVTGVNFGNRALAGEIRGVVFANVDGNGTQDTTEAGLAGWRVFLDQDGDGVYDLDSNGDGTADDPESSRVTNDRGEFAFTNLKTLHNYTVGLVSQSGFGISTPTTNSGRFQFVLGAGQIRSDVNFGVTASETGGQSGGAGILGFVFNDLDRDRIRDLGEGVAGISVYLDVNNNGVRDTTEPRATTDQAGGYEIEGVRIGTYAVRLEMAGTGFRQTSPLTNQFNRSLLTAGGGPQAVAFGNFNGDTRPDIAVANEDTSNVSVLLQSITGSGFNGTPADLELGPQRGFGAFAVTSGNFDGLNNGDDLAVANTFTGNVSMIKNTNGTFAAPVNTSVGSTPRSIITADLDGDGDLDLVTANELGNNVSILMNNGSGTFASSVSVPLGTVPLAIAVADVTGDGKLDLLVTLRDAKQVAVLKNNGSGGFPANLIHKVSVSDAPFGIAAGDFNGDGKQDFAVTKFLSNSVAVWLNPGNGVFTSVVPLSFAADVGPAAIVAVDLEGDGDLDLAVTHQARTNVTVTQDVSLLRNDGTGRFSSPESAGVLNESSGALRFSIAARDIDADGDPDLIVADKDSERISVLTNQLTAGAASVQVVSTNDVSGVSFTLETVFNGQLQVDLTGTQSVVVRAVSGELEVLKDGVRDESFRGVSAGSVQTITINGGDGNNVIDMSGVTTSAFTNADGVGITIHGGGGNDSILGSQFADNITGDAGNDTVNAGDGNDSISGGAGTDSLNGQAGADLLAGGSGNDTLIGGTGTDILSAAFDSDAALATSLRFSQTITVLPPNDTLQELELAEFTSGLTIAEDAAEQTVSLSDVIAIGAHPSYRIETSSNTTSVIPNPSVVYTSPNSTGSLQFTPVSDANGSATITVLVRGSGPNNTFDDSDDVTFSRTFSVTVNSVNDAPTLAAISDPAAINEDAGQQTIDLSGITAGGGESQELSVTAFSDNTSLIPNPVVTYTSDAATGSLRYTPVGNANGTATVTVTVRDAGLDGTPGNADDGMTSRVFSVTVNAVNDVPTITQIANQTVDEDGATSALTFTLSDIETEAGSLTVARGSSNTTLVPVSNIVLSGSGGTRTVVVTPAADQSGTATIALTVSDGTDSTPMSFTLTVNAVNDAPTLNTIASPAAIDEDAGQQTVNLSGISAGGGESQTLEVTAVSDNTSLIPNPTVTYTSAAATGSVKYTPVTNAFGTATVTVTVRDAGLDGTLGNSDDSTFSRTFSVAVTAVNDAPTITQIAN